MITTFRFKATKATGNKDVHYQVDLGQDILDNISDSIIRGHATANATVEIQNRKGAILRRSESAEDAQALLRETFGFEDATVEVYVPTTKTKVLTLADIRKAIASGKITKDDLEQMLS